MNKKLLRNIRNIRNIRNNKTSIRKFVVVFTTITILVSFLLSSCQVTNQLTFSSTNKMNGKDSINLEVSDYFVSVMEDLSNWDASSQNNQNGQNDAITDVAMNDFVQNLKNSKTTSSVNFNKTNENSYVGDFSFEDFNTLVIDLSNGNKNQSIIKTTKNGNKTHVEIRISLENYDELTQIVPFLANPNFEVYGPLYNHDLTKDDYLEMMGFILGNECPDEIEDSTIYIQVIAPKAVTQHNGTAKNTKTIEFSFPLIDFLLLHEPIYFYLEY